MLRTGVNDGSNNISIIRGGRVMLGRKSVCSILNPAKLPIFQQRRGEMGVLVVVGVCATRITNYQKSQIFEVSNY